MKKKELIYQGQLFRQELAGIVGELPYEYSSLEKIEEYIEKTVATPGKPDSKSFFEEDTYGKVIGFGAFAGEVIRRALPDVTWKMDEEDPQMFGLTNSEQGVAYVINKAFKRIYEGDGDNIAFFARVLISNHLKSESPNSAYFDEEDRSIATYGDSFLCMIFKGAYAGTHQIDNAISGNGTWLFTSSSESKDLVADEEMAFIFLDEVKERFPKLYASIKDRNPNESTRIVKDSSGDYRVQEGYKAPFFDSSSMASFQGNMKLEPLQWVKMNFAKVFRITAYLFISFLAMIKVHWAFGIVFLLCLLYNIWYWIGTKSTFGGGNVNPGKVVSINPTRVAVVTDMSKMIGTYPIVKIIETKLPKDDQVMGKFIPTVAIYNENPHGYPFWSEFHPVPVVHGVSDSKNVDYFMSEFSQEDLMAIDDALEEIKTTELGVYKLNTAMSDWSNYSHVDMNKGVRMEGPVDKAD